MKQTLALLLFFYSWGALGYWGAMPQQAPSSQICYSPVEMAALFSKPRRKKSGTSKSALKKKLRSLNRRIEKLEQKRGEIVGRLADSLNAKKAKVRKTRLAGKIEQYMYNKYNSWECGKGSSSGSSRSRGGGSAHLFQPLEFDVFTAFLGDEFLIPVEERTVSEKRTPASHKEKKNLKSKELPWLKGAAGFLKGLFSFQRSEEIHPLTKQSISYLPKALTFRDGSSLTLKFRLYPAAESPQSQSFRQIRDKSSSNDTEKPVTSKKIFPPSAEIPWSGLLSFTSLGLFDDMVFFLISPSVANALMISPKECVERGGIVPEKVSEDDTTKSITESQCIGLREESQSTIGSISVISEEGCREKGQVLSKDKTKCVTLYIYPLELHTSSCLWMIQPCQSLYIYPFELHTSSCLWMIQPCQSLYIYPLELHTSSCLWMIQPCQSLYIYPFELHTSSCLWMIQPCQSLYIYPLELHTSSCLWMIQPCQSLYIYPFELHTSSCLWMIQPCQSLYIYPLELHTSSCLWMIQPCQSLYIYPFELHTSSCLWMIQPCQSLYIYPFELHTSSCLWMIQPCQSLYIYPFELHTSSCLWMIQPCQSQADKCKETGRVVSSKDKTKCVTQTDKCKETGRVVSSKDKTKCVTQADKCKETGRVVSSKDKTKCVTQTDKCKETGRVVSSKDKTKCVTQTDKCKETGRVVSSKDKTKCVTQTDKCKETGRVVSSKDKTKCVTQADKCKEIGKVVSSKDKTKCVTQADRCKEIGRVVSSKDNTKCVTKEQKECEANDNTWSADKCLCKEGNQVTDNCKCEGNKEPVPKTGTNRICKTTCKADFSRNPQGVCVDCPEGKHNAKWQNDEAFGNKGNVNRGFCDPDRYGKRSRDCRDALGDLKNILSNIEKLKKRRAKLDEKIFNMENSEETEEDKTGLEASGLCIECVQELRALSRPSGGQMFGNILSMGLGTALSVFGLKEARSSAASANEMLALQGFPAQDNFGYSMAGLSVGFPFIANGLHGLTQANASQGGYGCSPTVSPYPPHPSMSRSFNPYGMY